MSLSFRICCSIFAGVTVEPAGEGVRRGGGWGVTFGQQLVEVDGCSVIYGFMLAFLTLHPHVCSHSVRPPNLLCPHLLKLSFLGLGRPSLGRSTRHKEKKNTLRKCRSLYFLKPCNVNSSFWFRCFFFMYFLKQGRTQSLFLHWLKAPELGFARRFEGNRAVSVISGQPCYPSFSPPPHILKKRRRKKRNMFLSLNNKPSLPQQLGFGARSKHIKTTIVWLWLYRVGAPVLSSREDWNELLWSLRS